MTALKTLTLRLRGAKTELEEAGLETENMAITTASLQKKLLALTGGKVDIMLDTNTFKSSTQILREMATAWEDMTDIQQAAALELMGGKRQANILSSIITNFDLVEDAITTSMNSSGSAIAENEKYLDSINGKIQQFTNAVQTMWNDELGSTAIKTVVDIGTALIKVVDTLGLIPSILIAIGSFKMLQYIFKGFNLSSFVNDIKDLTMGTQVLDAATRKTTFSLMSEQLQFNLASSSLVQYAIKTGLATAADVAKMTTTELLALSFSALTVSILSATKAMIAFLFTNPVGWAILAVGAIAGVVAIFNATTVSAEEASEQLAETKNKVSDLESELESLQTQLDETRDKIAELTALPSLSLTQQEDLDRLEREVELLERQIALKERQLAIEEAKLVEDAKTAIDTKWNKSGAYDLTNNGEIQDDKWYTWGESGKDVVDKAINEYERLMSENDSIDDLLINNTMSDNDVKKLYEDVFGAGAAGNESVSKSRQQMVGDLEKKRVENDSQLANIASSIEDFFKDPDYAGLTYGMSADIDAFLDDFNNAQLKWEKALYGDNSTSSIIESLWGPNASEEMKAVKSEIDKIMAEDGNWASDEEKWQSKNEAIKSYIGSLDETADGYQQLDYVINELGVDAQKIADYFTVLNGEFNSSTVEGITKQYAKAAEVINKFKDGLSVVGTDLDGNEVSMNFDDLFTFDDKTKEWQADAEKVSQILKDADEQTREQFTTYITHIKNAQQEAEDAGKDFDITAAFTQASKNIEIDGLLRVIDITKESLSSINKITFQDIADEIDGLIDTFDEFGKALEDTASAMDTLYKAQEQMNSSGRISVKTALELMQSTEDWNSVLKINGDTITLQDTAEQSLIQSRLNLIEQNINTALSEAELQYAKLEGADATLLQGDADLTTIEAQKEFDKALNQSAAVSAGLGAAAGNLIEKLKALSNLDFDSSAWNDSITGAFTTAYDSALTVLDKQTNPETAEEIKQRITDLRAQKDMIGQLKKNPNSFKNYYDYDKTPGDKYESNGKSKLENLQDKYDALISNIENKQTYIQNEIDRLEAEDKTVPLSYYEKQAELEEKKIPLLSKQRTELQALLSTQTAGTEGYNKTAEALWNVEHALQDSAKAAVDYRNKMTEAYETAFDDIATAYSNKDDFLSDQQSYIDKYNEYMELKGESPTVGSYNELKSIEEQKMADNYDELESLRSTLAQGLADGSIKEGSEEWVNMQKQIRQTEADILDNKIAIEQYNKSLKEMPVKNFETMRNAFALKDQFFSNQQSYIEGYAELLETQGIDVPQSVYDELISLEEKKQKNNIKNLQDARKGLEDIEAEGYTAADKEWQDAYQQVVDLEKGIQDSDIAMAKWNQTILDADFSKYEEFLDLLEDVNTEIDHLIKIASREDAFNDDGTWTEEGITSLGLKYQKYTTSQSLSNDIANEITKLNEAYQNKTEYDLLGDGVGVVLNEEQYEEKLKFFKEKQWAAIDDMYAAKDEMIAMAEERVNVIEESINKEIEAYQDLIDVRKEELQSERD